MKRDLRKVLLTLFAVFAVAMIVNVQAKASDTAYEKDQFGINNISGNSYEFWAYNSNWSEYSGFGAEIEISRPSGAIVTTQTFSSYRATVNLGTGAYRYRVRPYYNDASKHGDWSAYKYFVNTSAKIRTSTKYRGAYITLKKQKDVKKYIIYVSRSSDSGWKKSKTVKIGSKKTYKVHVTKKVKKGKTNYFKIVPVTKGDHKSEVYLKKGIYVFR